MKKWDIHYLVTMKSNKKAIREYIAKMVKQYLSEAEKDSKEGEDNPFTPEDEAEAPADEKADDSKEPSKAKDTKPEGIPIKFNSTKVKQYNKANFLSDEGVVKSISKQGVIVTTQPDGVDVLVNFDDISESVKKFFKKK
jgi:hypothetical protein